MWHYCSIGACRGKQLMVDFKVELTSLVTPCYAFWIGGVLKILGAHKFIDKNALHRFLLTCQSKYGGFSKFPGELPDLYHSHYGFSAFSLLEEHGLNPICFELGVTDIAAIEI